MKCSVLIYSVHKVTFIYISVTVKTLIICNSHKLYLADKTSLLVYVYRLFNYFIFRPYTKLHCMYALITT